MAENSVISKRVLAVIYSFLRKDGTLLTPDLKDTILPGITRDSVIQLAKAEGINAVERPIAVDELLTDGAELFVTGTAAGLVSIHNINYQGKDYQLPSRNFRESVASLLHAKLKGIQYGLLPDPYHWVVKI